MSNVCPHCGAEWETEDGLSFSHHEEDQYGNTQYDVYTEHRHCKGPVRHYQIREWHDDPPADFGMNVTPVGEWEDDPL